MLRDRLRHPLPRVPGGTDAGAGVGAAPGVRAGQRRRPGRRHEEGRRLQRRGAGGLRSLRRGRTEINSGSKITVHFQLECF